MAAGEASSCRQQKWPLQWDCTFTITFTGMNLVRELGLILMIYEQRWQNVWEPLPSKNKSKNYIVVNYWVQLPIYIYRLSHQNIQFGGSSFFCPLLFTYFYFEKNRDWSYNFSHMLLIKLGFACMGWKLWGLTLGGNGFVKSDCRWGIYLCTYVHT